jgi:hypothetical protein
MTVCGRRQPLLSNPLECPSWVNNGLSRPTAATSAFRGKADENDAKADMPAAMSAVGGKADLACQDLSGPFIARTRHSLVSKTGPLKGRNRPESVIHVGRRKCPLLDRKADITYEELIVRRSSQSDRPLFYLVADVGQADSLGRLIAISVIPRSLHGRCSQRQKPSSIEQ